MKRFLFISLIIIALAGSFWSFLKIRNRTSDLPISNSAVPDPATQIKQEKSLTKGVDEQIEKDQSSADMAKNEARKIVDLRPPFIIQAPFANWNDFVFQNACEEASIVMAINWIKGVKKIAPEEAQKEILNIVDFENKKFGYNTDTDVFDMQTIFQKYFKHQNVSVQENISLQDIKDELQKGNLVIVPAFGRLLKNPNYSGAGPIAHFLVIRGYNPQTKEFITNDSGTRKGEGYRYSEGVLFSAIWSYPSGKNNPAVPTENLKKTMLIVGR